MTAVAAMHLGPSSLVMIGTGLVLAAPGRRRRSWTGERDGRHRPAASDRRRNAGTGPLFRGVVVGLALMALGAVTAGPLGAAGGAVLGLMAAIGLVISGRRSGTVPGDPLAVALLLDLVGAVLAGGAPPDAALLAVADAAEMNRLAISAQPLRRVGRLLRLGAEPDLAWRELAGRPGYAEAAAAARRCATSGARLAAALQRSATTLRADRQAELAAAAERVGVWSLLPLGLCFLPAFACLGVLPVVIGVASDVLPGGLR